MRLSRKPLLFRGGLMIALLSGVLLVAGCGGSTGNVSGKVTYKGAALKGGTIGFVDSSGRVMGAALEGDGTYKIKNLPTGEYKVTVETASVRPPENLPVGGFGGQKTAPVAIRGSAT